MKLYEIYKNVILFFPQLFIILLVLTLITTMITLGFNINLWCGIGAIIFFALLTLYIIERIREDLRQ